MRKNIMKLIAVLMAFTLVFTGIEIPVFASEIPEEPAKEEAADITVEESEPENEAVSEEPATETESSIDKPDESKDEPEEDEEDEEKEDVAFEGSKTVSGVTVNVSADEGVFPEGSTLSVSTVSSGEKDEIDEAVEEEREENRNVASSYTFDIKVLNKDGEETEPDTSKGKVRVTFALSEADNDNLTADIYHIGDDMKAEKLDTDTTTEGGEPAVTAETDGFSYYTVEFTYDEKQYVMEGDTEVPLQDVLDYVGIAGTVTNARVSNDELFSAENRNGTWYLVAHKAFKSREWLKVTLDGVEMDVEIVVTDDAGKTYTFKPNGVWDENGNQLLGYVYLNTNDTLKFEGSEGEGGGITIRFYRAFSDYQNIGTYYSGQKTVYELFKEKVVLEVHNGGTPGTYNFGRIITVNLDANGGTVSQTTFEASPSQAYFPDYVEIPTRQGYKFLGYYGTFNSEEKMWYDADGKHKWATYLIEDGFTLYAHWEVLASTVTLKPNGGSGSDFTVTATYGNNMPAIASANLPARTGYTFAGYYDTNAQTGGTQYYTSSGVSARTWNKTANTALYARWTANTYTVTLNKNGGSEGSTSVQATYDSNMPSATMPTRNGYVFQGYYDTNAQTGGTQYYTSSGASARKWNKTANTILYARWKEIAAVSTAPEGISGLVYTSQPQALVTEGQVQNATWSKIQYRLGDSGTWSDDIPSQTAAGSYEVYYKATSTNTDSCVDSAVSGPVSVTIGKATEPLVITPDSGQSKHYGDSDPTLTYTVTGGLLGNDNSSVVSGSLKRAAGDNVGTYEILDDNLTASNYNISVTSGVMFTITKAAAPASTAAGLSAAQKPTGPDLAYTGNDQDLLTPPSSAPTGYTVKYSLNGTDWSTTIPQASEDGDYTVQVRYVADSNHDPIEGTLSIPVSIKVAATIGGNKYGTIDEAVTVWNASGGTLVLQDDITTSSTLNLNANVVRNLNLNGHSITKTGTGAAISVSGGSLTVNDSGTDGTITGGGTGAGIEVSGSAGLTVSSGTVTSQSGYGINSSTSGALQITGSSSVGGNGVHLGTGSKIDLSQGLTSNKPVKVTMQTPGEFTVNGNYDSSTDAGYEAAESDFASGDGGYGISISYGQATLVEAIVYGGITVNGKPLNSSNIERLLPGITEAGGVTYTAGSPNTLTINGNYTIPEGVTIDVSAGTSIVIPSGNTLTNNGTISGAGTIQNNGTFVNNGTVNTTAVVNANGSTLTNGTGGVMSGPVTNNGGTVTNNGTMSGTVTNNSGTINNNGNLSGTTTNASGAVLNNNTGGNITGSVNNSGEFINAGTISGNGTIANTGSNATITNNGTINTTGAVTNGSGSTISNSAGKTINSPVTNNGTMNNAGTLSGSVSNEAIGTLNNVAGGNITGNLNNVSGGNVRNNEGATISGNVTNAGTLINNGTITGNGKNVVNSGTLQNVGTINNTGGVDNTGNLYNDQGKTIAAPVNNSAGGTVENNGTMSGTVSNTGAGSHINNNNGATISGDLNNASGGEVTNASGAGITGNVNNGSGATLNNNGDISGAGKTVTNSGNMTNNGTVTSTGGVNNTGGILTNNAGKEIAAPVNNSAGGTVENNGTMSGTVSNTGAGSHINNNNGATISGDLNNASGGEVTNASGAGITGNVNNGSGATLNNNGDISGTGKTVTNSGTMTNNGSVTSTGGVKNTGGTLTNNAGKEIAAPVVNSSGGTVNNNGTLSGTVTNMENGSTVNNGNGATISGDLTNAAGGSVTNENGGTLSGNVNNASGATFNNGGEISGNGKSVTNSGTMTNDGTISAGEGVRNTGGTLTNNAGKDINVPVTNSGGGTVDNNGNINGAVTNVGANSQINNNDGAAITGDLNNASGASVTNATGAQVTGNVTNTGAVNNGGTITGNVTNDKTGNSAGVISNNENGTVTGDVENKPGAIFSSMPGSNVGGAVNNGGTIIDGGGTAAGGITNSNTSTKITAPDGKQDQVTVSPSGQISVPAGTNIEKGKADGTSETVTLPQGAGSNDTSYTIPASKLDEVKLEEDKVVLPEGSSVTKDGQTTRLDYGGTVDRNGNVTVTPPPVVPDPVVPGPVNPDPVTPAPATPSTDNNKTDDMSRKKDEAALNNYLDDIYKNMLGRDMDASGNNSWKDMLNSGKGSMADLVVGIVNSPEFNSKEMSNSEYLDKLYKGILGRTPTAEEKQKWIDFLDKGGSRGKVLEGFVNSEEFSKLCDKMGYPRGSVNVASDGKPEAAYSSNLDGFVMRLYKYVLKRRGESLGVEYWCENLRDKKLSPVEVASRFFYSDEFINNKVSDEDFVETLYITFLDRPSEPAGKKYWVDKLKNGSTREEIIQGFVYSKEFGKIIESFGLD